VERVSRLLRNEFIFIVYSFVLVVLVVSRPSSVLEFPEYIDWRTIASLAGLILISKGFQLSGYFDWFARRSLTRISSERNLALGLVGTAAFLSTFLTNDVGLILVVPLTMSYSKYLKNDLGKVIIFEAIGANVGSSVSPIGNPQNIFIYRFMDVPFHKFFLKMLPVGVIMGGILVSFIYFSTSSTEMEFRTRLENGGTDRRLFLVSFLSLILFIVTMELNLETFSVFPLMILFLIIERKVIFESNWMLLLLFIVFFLDSSMLSREEWVKNLFDSTHSLSAGKIYSLSILVSQVMSNVPAAILISHFTDRWVPLAIGVNVGGNGLVIASLANIIAIRLSRRRDLLVKFHFYSIPFMAISFLLISFFVIPIFK